jgi:hypothetical protein
MEACAACALHARRPGNGLQYYELPALTAAFSVARFSCSTSWRFRATDSVNTATRRASACRRRTESNTLYSSVTASWTSTTAALEVAGDRANSEHSMLNADRSRAWALGIARGRPQTTNGQPNPHTARTTSLQHARPHSPPPVQITQWRTSTRTSCTLRQLGGVAEAGAPNQCLTETW